MKENTYKRKKDGANSKQQSSFICDDKEEKFCDFPLTLTGADGQTMIIQMEKIGIFSDPVGSIDTTEQTGVKFPRLQERENAWLRFALVMIIESLRFLPQGSEEWAMKLVT